MTGRIHPTSRARFLRQPRSLEWQEQGLCKQPGVPPEMFYPEKGEGAREAKKLCEQCPVRLLCLEYALSNDERFGIWGGLSERERRKVKHARKAAADARAAREAA